MSEPISAPDPAFDEDEVLDKKKKKVKSTNPKDDLLKSIEKKYGKVYFDEKYIKENPKVMIPTTPALDIALGGGIPEGSWTLISGDPKKGKTSLILQIAANAQKLGRHIYYLNVEHRFGEKNLTTVRDLIMTEDKFTLIQSTVESPISAEKFLEIGAEIIESHPGSVLILDSISCLCSEKESGREIGDSGRPEGPKLFAQFCRQNASKVPLNNISFIGVLHLIANTSGYGPTKYEDGGNKIQYQADCKLRVKKTESWDKGTGDDKKVIGSIVTWDVLVAPNGAPNQQAQTYLRYGYGYDAIWEVMNLACDYGLILKGGAWQTYTTKDGREIKVQGQAKMYNYFKENPLDYETLYNDVKELAYVSDGD